jgi:hypothetical protein
VPPSSNSTGAIASSDDPSVSTNAPGSNEAITVAPLALVLVANPAVPPALTKLRAADESASVVSDVSWSLPAGAQPISAAPTHNNPTALSHRRHLSTP